MFLMAVSTSSQHHFQLPHKAFSYMYPLYVSVLIRLVYHLHTKPQREPCFHMNRCKEQSPEDNLHTYC